MYTYRLSITHNGVEVGSATFQAEDDKQAAIFALPYLEAFSEEGTYNGWEVTRV